MTGPGVREIFGLPVIPNNMSFDLDLFNTTIHRDRKWKAEDLSYMSYFVKNF